MPSLAPFWQIHALDFRGHGKSDKRGNEYCVTDYVEDALACLRSISKPAFVYGHSLGAMVAAAVAAAEPRLVRGIVLEDPPFDTLGQRIRETAFYSYFSSVRKVARSGGNVDELHSQLSELPIPGPNDGELVRLGDIRDPSSLRFSAACLASVDPSVLDPLLDGRWLTGYDIDHVLLGIQCPTLLLQADTSQGGMLTDDDASRVERLVPICSRIEFPGTGHLIHWTATQDTLRCVIGFLGSLLIESAAGKVPAGGLKRDPAHEDGHRRHDYQKRAVG
jgi:pimeloyl-ACP methyl ester carboxylesterase